MTFRSKVQFSALALLVAAVLASGCGSSSESPTAPSGLNLAGTWAGNLGSNSNDRNAVTWTATQSGSSPTGAFGITLDEGDALQKVNGTLAGTVSGTQVSWTLTFPAGAFTAAGSATCSVTGTGTSSATTTSSISVSLNLTFAQACVGTVTDRTSEVDQLTLTK